MNEKFDLEAQYKLYLSRVGMHQAALHPVQEKIMKDTFMAACGIMLVTLRDDIGAIENEMEAINIMQNMLDQVGNHFLQYN
jgi:hypothetical protein